MGKSEFVMKSHKKQEHEDNSNNIRLVENLKIFKILQANMEEIKSEPKDKCEDKSMRSVISGIGRKPRYPCDKCHYNQDNTNH